MPYPVWMRHLIYTFIFEKFEANMRRSGLHFGKEKKKVNVPIVKEVITWILEITKKREK